MIDRLLRRLPISWRILGPYLLIMASLGILLFGFSVTFKALLDRIVDLRDIRLEQQFISLIKDRLLFTISIGAILLVLGLVWILLSRRSLKRQINELRNRVEDIRAGRADENMPVGQLDELGLLALSIRHLTAQTAKERKDYARLIEDRSALVKEHAVQLQAASELARQVSDARDLVILADRCAHLIQERFNFYHVGIYLIDDERRFIVLKAAAGLAGSLDLQMGKKIRLGEVNLISNAAVSGETRIINNVDTDYIFRRDPLLPDTRAEAIFPLKAGSEVVGVVDVHSLILNAFGEDETVTLQILADILAIAVQNVRLVQSLQKSALEANILYQRYTQAIWSREALGKRAGGYEYNLFEVKPIEGKAGYRYDLPSEVLERLRSGKATRVKRSALEPAQAPGGEASSAEQSVLLVPLLLYNQIVGIIGLEEAEPERVWTDDEIAVIEAVANQITLSLDNARLLEEAQFRSSQLRLLQEVTAVAASHTNLLELLDNVSQKLRASFDLFHCGMLLLEPDGQALSLVASASADPFTPGARMVEFKIPLHGNSLLESIVRERSSRIFYDVQKKAAEGEGSQLGALQSYLQARGVKTVIFVPLQSRGEVVGVASLEIADSSRRFSTDDLQLLDQISLQISSAIDVARSFEQATLRADRERRVSEITSRIRETLDIQTILKTAAQEVRQVLGVPEVTVRLTSVEDGKGGARKFPAE